MKVKIKKSDARVGIKRGDVYKARPYWLDSGKVVLLYRNGREKCTEYLENVTVLEEATSSERRKAETELNRVGGMLFEVGLLRKIIR